MEGEISPARILIAGSRNWSNRKIVEEALETELPAIPRHLPVVLAHCDTQVNGILTGADRMVQDIWAMWLRQWPILDLLPSERHPITNYTDHLHRAKHMVSLGATVCLTFCNQYTSEASHTARLARDAGIRTVDYGISTRVEDKPSVEPFLAQVA